MAEVEALDGASSLCQPFLAVLPISGVSVTVMGISGVHFTLCSSDAIAAKLEQLQFELGEGPQWEAARTGELVAITDVHSDAHRDWPVFGASLTELPIGAVFCVPIQMGAVTVGVATLFSETPIELDPDQSVTAFAIASAIAGSVVQQATTSANDDRGIESEAAPQLRREVHQATGMILVQANTSATDAFARLQAYAFANGRSVQSVAHDVVIGVLTFDSAS